MKIQKKSNMSKLLARWCELLKHNILNENGIVILRAKLSI